MKESHNKICRELFCLGLLFVGTVGINNILSSKMSFAEFSALQIFRMPTVQASRLVYFLGLQTKYAKISYTLASGTGHLPVHFCFKMQPVLLSDFYRMWTDIFAGGTLPNCVQNLIGTKHRVYFWRTEHTLNFLHL